MSKRILDGTWSPQWRGEVERAPEFLSFLDTQYHVLYLNHRSAGDLPHDLGSALDYVSPAYHEGLFAAVDRARSTGLPQHFESEAASAGGGRSFYSNWIVRLRIGPDADGEEVFAFIATDVTHRRRIEDALDRSEGTLRALVDHAADYIAILSLDGRIEFENRFLDVRPPRAPGDHSLDRLVDASSRAQAREALERVRSTSSTASFECTLELNDGLREFLARLSPIVSAGQVTNVALIATDIRAQKEAERVREQLAAQLHQAQKLEAIGQLTGGIAHDFNNLLMIIAGSIEAAQLERDPTVARRDLARALEGVRRAASVTEHLLSISCKRALQPRKVDVGALVQGMEQLLARTLGETIQVAAIDPPEPLVCEVDPVQLESVLLNLGLNARDAMPRGGHLTLRTSSRRVGREEAGSDALSPGDYVVVEVRDTGTGMSPEVLQHAMEPFFTTKSHGRGSGLGLSVAYGFLQQSGGTLRLHSRPGQGTRAEILLPRSQEGVRPSPSEPAATAGTRTEASERLLIVEDDAEVRRVLARMAESIGYRAHVTADA